MISAWWLLLIVPLSVFTGFFLAALCKAASKDDDVYYEDDKPFSGLLEDE